MTVTGTSIAATVFGRGAWWAWSLLGGLLLATAHARFAAWPFAHFALLPLLCMAAREGTRRSAYAGMLTIMPTLGAACYWLARVEQRPGRLVMALGACAVEIDRNLV